MHTNQTICDRLATAFLPHHGKADLRDYGNRVDAQVYAADGQLLKQRTVPVSMLRTESGLAIFIRDIREELEEQGVKLAPWSPP
jgi:hypothetical protein